ncbi:MAG: ATP-binding protein [Planctomycetaceae bacterium]|jgi:predicted ATPase|nr:ATP-binding protein [Planctomycetaceae bacterium]
MIKKITIKNFKAIQSATIKLTDLSVFIGNNGSGKSSVIEALQTLQEILLRGVSAAFQDRWYGFEYIYNTSNTKITGKKLFENDIEIILQGKLGKNSFIYKVGFNTIPNGDLYVVTNESLKNGNKTVFEKKITNMQRNNGVIISTLSDNQFHTSLQLSETKESFGIDFRNYILSWQFLTLEPERMYFPTQRNYSTQMVRMKKSGENLADFFRRLLDRLELSDLIFDKLHYVLPDLDYVGGEEVDVQKLIYLFFKEKKNERRIPSWLFSSGTLRILAMLSILNCETPPPIVFIEEVENGLDPRTLNLLVEEIRGMLPKHQFIVTTHSPYFLDLVDLQHVVVAERNDCKTEFYRPDDDEKLKMWKEKFSVGDLYTMNQLTKK